ncbi:hypothetical protein CHS0354_009749 [Potamilus streckersoni]|uniref:Phosphatidic acid phosphatase type 2/haloperoxidase domain-containing protein n=1 Tax=Potamilus streckersoni TaxID=2493646 RepID=A0AAE0TI70_9BIVA|nr:hypothetical protein CHS0354_009749 [Potamilus streckersoni]
MSLKHRKSNIKDENNVNNESSDVKENNNVLDVIFAFDERLTRACSVCAQADSPLGYLRPLMKILEISCHGIPWLLGNLALLLSVHRTEHIEILVNLLTALILDLIIIAIVKLLFRRQRPVHNQMDMFATVSIDNYSFPSGHASRAAMLVCFFLFHVTDNAYHRILVILWSLVVSSSRVFLGRHHVLDVTCGFALGIIEYLLVYNIWIPQNKCVDLLDPYMQYFHL